MTDAIRKATCARDKMQVSAPGEPKRSMLRSYQESRRLSGSAFNGSPYWSDDRIKRAGEVRTYRRPSQDDTTCGATLWWRADCAQVEIGHAAGALGGPALPPRQKAFWTQGRPQWAVALADIPSDERQ